MFYGHDKSAVCAMESVKRNSALERCFLFNEIASILRQFIDRPVVMKTDERLMFNVRLFTHGSAVIRQRICGMAAGNHSVDLTWRRR